jgi:hypothetical protein
MVVASTYWLKLTGHAMAFKVSYDGKEKLLALGDIHCLWLMPEQNVMKLEKGIAGGIDPFKKEHKAERSAGQKHLQQIALEWHSMKVKNGQLGMPLTFSKLSIKIFFLFRSTACCGHFVELLNVLKKIEARGATEKARKCQRCGEVFRYAIVTGRAEYNPALISPVPCRGMNLHITRS